MISTVILGHHNIQVGKILGKNSWVLVRNWHCRCQGQAEGDCKNFCEDCKEESCEFTREGLMWLELDTEVSVVGGGASVANDSCTMWGAWAPFTMASGGSGGPSMARALPAGGPSIASFGSGAAKACCCAAGLLGDLGPKE